MSEKRTATPTQHPAQSKRLPSTKTIDRDLTVDMPPALRHYREVIIQNPPEIVIMDTGDPSNPVVEVLVQGDAASIRQSPYTSLLPTPLTSFVGREGEVRQLVSVVQGGDHRIVTLTGPGGVGKTRLALKAASEIESSGTHEISFVVLTAVNDPALVAPTIGHVFGLSDIHEHSLPGRLALELHEMPHLLVIDNLEHVIDAAPLLAKVAAACPSLTILATSRVPLRLSGERQYQVPPLPLSPSSPDDDQWKDVAAVQLFLERAGLQGEAMADDQRFAISAICRKLDGLPLAIELAAAKTRVLPPRDLAARLDVALPLLTDGPRDAPERHRTMRAAIAWSYDLLSCDGQALFRSLSVFNGGFTLEAAAKVANMDVTAVIDGITNLSDYGLVRPMDGDHNPLRFTMLETIREFGLEQLIARGHDRRASDNHAAWFTGLLESPEPEIFMDATYRKFPFPGEQDNARTALRWSLAQGKSDVAANLALGLSLFWWEAGFFTEAREALAQVLTMPNPLPAEKLAALLGIAAEFAFQQSDFEASGALATEALQIARDLGDTHRIRWHLRQIGWVALVFDPPSAIAPIEEIVALCYAQGNGEATAHALFMLAMTKAYADQLPQAMAHVEEAQSIIGSLDSVGLAVRAESIQMRGTLAGYLGRYDQAEPDLREALALRREQGNKVYEMHCLRDLGHVALGRGDRSTAASHFAAALELAFLLGSEHGKSYCFVEIASVSYDFEASANLLGAEARLRQRLRLSNMPTELALREGTTQRVRESLGKAQFQSAFIAGASKSTIELYEIAQHALSTALSAPGESDSLLTTREREVLILIAQGKSDREIGDALFVSRRTAATHVRNVLAKLDVHSRAAAAAWAVRNNIA